MKTAIILLAFFAIPFLSYSAEWEVKIDGITYASDDGVTCYTAKADLDLTEAVILSEVEGRKVTAIGDLSFKNCKSLKTVSIPSTVLSICANAFWQCESITELFIPESIEHISISALLDCSLLSIEVDPANKYYSSEDGILYNADKTILHYYPRCKTGEFQIPERVLEIGPCSFYRCHLASIIFPSTLQRIPESCFYGSGYLKEIIFPEDCHIKEIEGSAFFDCDLQQLILPASLEKIGRYAFSYNAHLTKLWLPESVKLTEGHEFSDCWAIEEVHIKNEEPYQVAAFVFNLQITPKPRYLFVPKGCRESYEEYKCWTNLFYILEEGQDRSEAGIENVEMDKSEDRAYDLMGRKTRNGHNGRIQILNGKKVFR